MAIPTTWKDANQPLGSDDRCRRIRALQQFAGDFLDRLVAAGIEPDQVVWPPQFRRGKGAFEAVAPVRNLGGLQRHAVAVRLIRPGVEMNAILRWPESIR